MAVPPEISGSLLGSGNLILGRYELIRELGRGGMGVVWLARDRTLQIDLALKFLPDVLRQDRASLEELRDEAVRNLRLTNEHIVRTYDFIEGDGVAGITMEYVDGSTLGGLKVERADKHLEVAELLPLVRHLCEALFYAHTQPKVVHRDLKPANLMVTKDGRLKVTDFGIARSISDSFSRVSNAQPTSGTLMFMSPQQLMGDPPRPSDDMYSVGATIYDLLTSKPPFYTGSIHAQVIQAHPPSMAERRGQLEKVGEPIPPAWEEVVSACLSKEPGDRPATALEIIRRLESLATTPGRPPTPPPISPSVQPPATTHPAWQNLPPVPTLPSFSPAHGAPPYGSSPTVPPPPPPAPEPRRSQWALIALLMIIGVLAVGGGIYLATRGDGSNSVAERGTPIPDPYVPPTPAPVPVPTLQTGRIIVNTIPSGARVLIDGREVGTSPTTVSEVEPGDHRVRVEKADYEPLDLTMHVEAGRTVDAGALALAKRPPEPPAQPSPRPAPVPPSQVEDFSLSDSMAMAVCSRYVSFTQLRNAAGLIECYADPVDYHNEGVLGRARLRESINSYFRDWPYFDIAVLNMTASPTDDPMVKTVKVDYRFLAKRGSKFSRGVAHDLLTVKRFGDDALITRFRQTITDPKRNF